MTGPFKTFINFLEDLYQTDYNGEEITFDDIANLLDCAILVIVNRNRKTGITIKQRKIVLSRLEQFLATVRTH
jgi:hypothetical protein